MPSDYPDSRLENREQATNRPPAPRWALRAIQSVARTTEAAGGRSEMYRREGASVTGAWRPRHVTTRSLSSPGISTVAWASVPQCTLSAHSRPAFEVVSDHGVPVRENAPSWLR